MLRIFICDGGIHVGKLMGTVLVLQSYEICKAYDGREALEMVEKCQPDLILMDVMMSMLDGFKITKALKDKPAT